mmetsp:Transcript_60402/g.194504  ORF Transcript_60402/g.194504 Transcript_60402/m.194504 type:complete len:679 (+) Transcript_60402:98-2134(+)
MDHAAAGVEEAEGKTVKIEPLDNVYSYLMFALPIEDWKEPKKLTWNKALAYTLVMCTLILQSILLYAIFNEVVTGDIIWRDSIMGKTGQAWGPFHDDSSCNRGGSLCSKNDHGFSCAPPSVQLTGRWEELDTNGDGVWTKEEVLEARDKLKCKYVVDPVEVFNVFVTFLLKRENIIWIHPDVRAGKKIPKAYFMYASGDLIMCGYRNSNMCPNLLLRGYFDAPLIYGKAPRVGTTIRSALDYCFTLLESGGICERTLPSTYAVWRKSSEDQCLGAEFSKAVYEHPTTGRTKSMLTVDYQARKDYSRVDKSFLFFIYKSIIIGMFLLAMFAEIKDILNYFTWVLKFPSDTDFPGNEIKAEKDEESEEVKYTIQGVSDGHRAIVAFLQFSRFIMIVVLTMVGVTFLQKDTDWVNLLLNSVALVFIVEIGNNLYAQVLSPELRERCESTEPMEVPMPGPSALNDRPALKDLLLFALLLLALFLTMYLHFLFVGKPLSKALECACLSQGEHCYEAEAYGHVFWFDYWNHVVPEVIEEIKKLEEAGGGGNGTAPAPAPAAASAFIQDSSAAPAASALALAPDVIEDSDGHVRLKLTRAQASALLRLAEGDFTTPALPTTSWAPLPDTPMPTPEVAREPERPSPQLRKRWWHVRQHQQLLSLLWSAGLDSPADSWDGPSSGIFS